jgi:mercuric ion transport protein
MTDSTPAPRPSAPRRTTVRWSDGTGAVGAIFAALCCMGAPVIVGVLGAIGLSWLRRDAILLPIMFLSLGVALWGLARDQRRHGAIGPLVLAVVGTVALVAGVVFVRGFPAPQLIYGGAIALVAATVWNIVARRTPVERSALL